ncbi:MAG: hypothetical protein WBS19_07090, partial [Candidatus Korobacteraceae bacterium]
SKRSLVCAICALTLSVAGCYRPIGPQSVARDRHLYAASLSDSWKEQTLLNIVKMRYLDPPVFVDVGNIVASYSLVQGVSAGGNIVPNNQTPDATVGGFGTYSNTPTITYTPLTGSKFIRGLATPFPPEAIFSSIEAGMPADVILFASVVSINGLRNQEATLQGITPADPDFHRVRALARKIQLSGAVRIEVKKQAGEEMVSFMTFRTEKVPPEVQSDIAELRQLLKLDPAASEYQVRFGAVPENNREIAVITRSILSMMQTMAAEVGVPKEDLARGWAFPGFEHAEATPGVVRLIHIHSGKSVPADAFVSVKYENNWFWIDKGDLESKQMFSLIMMLFTMVDTGPQANQPVLTIPAH